jgi:NTP pyrophosphatase (non-canonical NTP hydrolase)
MEFDYSKFVESRKKSSIAIQQQLTPADCDAIHMLMGICGEAGELLDAVKKAAIYRKPLDMKNVVEELGDIEFYLEGFRQTFGLNRDRVLVENMRKLSVRYSEEYSDQQAQDRADKE